MSDILAKLIVYFIMGIMAGPFFALFLTPIIAVLGVIFFLPFIQDDLIKKAIKDGHVIEATLVESFDEVNDSETTGGYYTNRKIGVYKYLCKEKMRKIRIVSTEEMSEKIYLYYIKNPKKAITAGELGSREIPWIRIYLTISVLIMSAIVIIGMILG